MSIFAAPERGVNISVTSAATVLVIVQHRVLFLVFQRHFVRAPLRDGVK